MSIGKKEEVKIIQKWKLFGGWRRRKRRHWKKKKTLEEKINQQIVRALVPSTYVRGGTGTLFMYVVYYH